MGTELVAGVDCSTQGTKVVVADATSGDIVAIGRAPHTVTGTGGARESDPAEWFDALRLALAETGIADRIDAISIAAQQHGLVVLDGERTVLRPAILWNDTRATAQAQRLVEALGGPAQAARLIGSVPGPAFTVSSWMWLREHESRLASAVRHVRLPHDWLTERLTGTAVTDRGDVSATGWWSATTSAYVPEVLELPEVALDVSALPHVLGANEAAGTVTREAAAALGLRAGILVGPGTGDNPAAALAIAAPAGQPVVSLGTSGTIYTTSTTPATDATATVVGLADATGRYLPLACTLNCTLAVDRFAEWLGLDRSDVADDSGGLVILPFLDGERTPNLPRAAGSIVGLRHETTRQQILRAAYEGAAYSLVEAIDFVDAHSSGLLPDAPIVLVGGGAKGAAWQDCLADLTGRAIATVDLPEQTAFGAAIQAKAALDGGEVDVIARSWARPAVVVREQRDVRVATLERIRSTRNALAAFNA